MSTSFRKDFAIFGIDPGNTTGLVVYFGGELDVIKQLAPEDVRRVIMSVAEKLQLIPDMSLIFACERFNIGRETLKNSRQPDALKITGTVRDIANEVRAVFVEQNPSDAKKMGSDETLRRIGWYRPGLRHANDAAAQALLILSKLRPSEFESVMGI